MIVKKMIIELPKDKFKGYIALTRNEAIVSAVESIEKGKGHFSELLDLLFVIRNRIEVPTPSNQMREILLRKDFHSEKKWFDGFNCFGEIMVKENGKT